MGLPDGIQVGPPPRRGVARTALAVAAKELASSLRDRQTLVYLVVLPLVLYPVLFWASLEAATVLQGTEEGRSARVGLAVAEGAAPDTERVADALAADEGTRHPGPLAVERAPEGDARALLTGRDAALDALVSIRAAPEPSTLAFDSTRARSRLARERVRERLAALAGVLRARALERGGPPDASLAPLRLELHDLAERSERGAYVFSLLVPILFVSMGILGAFFPAVDVTAGERERGTLETTLLLPVPRAGIHLGKVAAVTAAATIAAALNLIGVALAGERLLASLAHEGVGDAIAIPWARLAALLPLGVVFLACASALLVAAASCTDTFRQGQSLLGAVQIVLLAPAFVALLPGLEPTRGLACVPVVQTVLAFRTILQRGAAADPGFLALAAGTQVAYAALATALALRLVGRERWSAARAR